MKIYLIRHGIAGNRIGGEITDDSQRPLTDEGRTETKIVGLGLRRLGVKPDLIVSSTLVRARQTAEILAEVFGVTRDVKVCEALCPGGTASDLYKFLREHKSVQQVFLVGHEPDMGRLAGTMLWAGPELDVPFKKAGVCRIDVTSIPPTAPGTLKWFITPKIAGAIAGK
ncbi:MAG: phosphohistidine phosphatase SixA [Candidatus Obscuribacterales bacterium]|nr:phosphohistidine phosphatase SixA [Candidatus Obscuribacterales bacterium]